MTNSSEPEPLTKEICLHIAQTIEDGFERHAVEIRPHSDIAMLIKDTLWLADHLDTSPERLTRKELDRWIHAFLRVQQGRNISFTFERLINAQIPQEKLRILQKRLDYLGEKGDSHAPEVFFELEVAGRIARQYPGWKILFEEPDIIIEYPTGRVALSCKKAKSERNLSKRLSEAADQGARAKVPFFVIVDAQEILGSPFPEKLVRASTQEDLAAKCSGFLADLIVRCSKPIATALDKGAGGVIFCARCVGLVEKPRLSLCWCLRHQCCPNLSIRDTGYALKYLVQMMEE